MLQEKHDNALARSLFRSRTPYGKLLRGLPIALLFVLSTLSGYAFNLHQISHHDGLSNSAILSLAQDNEGVMWFGSCDGLNRYDGDRIELYHPDEPHLQLSGNLIERIVSVNDTILWVSTNYGLNRVNTRTREILYFNNYRGLTELASGKESKLFFLDENNTLLYFHASSRQPERLDIESLANKRIVRILTDSQSVLWIFLDNGDELSYRLTSDEKGTVSASHLKTYSGNPRILHISQEKDEVFQVTEEGIICCKNLLTREQQAIYRIPTDLFQADQVSGILEYHHDLYIGVRDRGLVRLHRATQTPDQSYRPEWMKIGTGVFELHKDIRQDLIWIATDGQGVYTLSNDRYSFSYLRSSELPVFVQKPIRALYKDHDGALWVGTKGDGLLRITDFKAGQKIKAEECHRFTTANSNLNNNKVFSLTPSVHPLLWIGNGEGLNVYSYTRKRMEKLRVQDSLGVALRYAHGIVELNDSTLWISSVGNGIFRIIYEHTPQAVRLKHVMRYSVHNNRAHTNYFFTVHRENDSTLWFGNRGYGSFRLNTNSLQLEQMQLNNFCNSQTINDVFAVTHTPGQLWLGTSLGLIRFTNGLNYQIYNRKQGFPNNTVHAIEPTEKGELWVSTNNGLVLFNPEDESVHAFGHKEGLLITEFSDGASFRDPKSGTLYFGGVDGIVSVHEKEGLMEQYQPAIRFNKLTIYGKERNIYDYLHPEKDKEKLVLRADDNFFTIGFMAVDHLKKEQITYEYKLGGFQEQWIPCSDRRITFTNLSPGTYPLEIRPLGSSDPSSIHFMEITVLAPWYASGWSYLLYMVIGILIVIFGFYINHRWYTLREIAVVSQINKKKQEELLEAKMQFFTNITHELCTPLTLIMGPCERLLREDHVPEVRHYGKLIRENALRLHKLIQDLIDFRKMETEHKPCNLQEVSVTNLLQERMNLFLELAKEHNISYSGPDAGNINWNTDPEWFERITTNLISNAFKYTPDNGFIRVELEAKEEQLCLRITNSGSGIPPEKVQTLFERFRILDNTEPGKREPEFRNGLGLAICDSLVKMLGGDISVSSILNRETSFLVTLPLLPLTSCNRVGEEPAQQSEPEATPLVPENSETRDIRILSAEHPTLLIVDDEPEMALFIRDLFGQSYNLITLQNSSEVLPVLREFRIDLIIMDVRMPGPDGLELTRKIKENKLYKAIPVILLSADNQPEAHHAGIEAGADIYLTKPFDIDYLLSLCERYLNRTQELKEFYNTGFSSFVVDHGRLLHQDDKAFIERVLEVIHTRYQDPELCVDKISSELGMSSRHLYRKIKTLSDKSPADLLKDYRLDEVRKLLLTTNLSIDEIMYQTGFSNRGNFFRIFSQRFGMSPRKYRIHQLQEVRESAGK